MYDQVLLDHKFLPTKPTWGALAVFFFKKSLFKRSSPARLGEPELLGLCRWRLHGQHGDRSRGELGCFGGGLHGLGTTQWHSDGLVLRAVDRFFSSGLGG